MPIKIILIANLILIQLQTYAAEADTVLNMVISKPYFYNVVKNENGSVMYLNSGDWVENLTALEYKKSKWCIYEYKKEHYDLLEMKEDVIVENYMTKILS